MATRKEEKERRRAERLEAERREAAASRKRMMLGYGAAGLLTVAVIAGIVVVIASSGGGSDSGAPANAHIFSIAGATTNGATPDDREGTAPPPVKQADLQAAAAAAGCDLRLNLPDEGSNHLSPNAPTPRYGTNPPTSGNHSPIPQSDGAYSTTPPSLNFVHSLEHGRVEIEYSPDLSEQDQLALKGLFDESPEGMLLFPDAKMPYAVAATAWTQLMGCKRYDGPKTLDAIRAFRDQFRGRGPEAVPLGPSG